MTSQADRASAYADILTGLRDLTDETAIARFDAALDGLVAAGRLGADDAGQLRFWHREGLRNQAEQLIATATTVLAGIDTARDEARAATEQAGNVWGRREGASGDDQTVDLRDDVLASGRAPAAPRGYVVRNIPAEVSPDRLDSADLSEPSAPVSPSSARTAGRHRADEPSPFAPRSPFGGPPVGAPTGPPAAPDAFVTTPPIGTTDANVATVNNPDEFAEAPARRRRLLVAGLTVIDDRVREADGTDDSSGTTTGGQPAVG